jgi:hypothetical protein
MKRMNATHTAIWLGLASLFGGCATEKEVLFFGTHTAVGVDVSGTVGVPDSVSFGYRRREVAIVPPKKDGTARSVLGAIDADLGVGEARIKQLFATGEAAKIAASTKPFGDDARKAVVQNEKPDGSSTSGVMPILFTAEANFSLLHIQGSSSTLAPKVSLGYSRSEITLIPVADGDKEAASVYADISIDTEETAKSPTNPSSNVEKIVGQHPSRFSTGVRLVQRFATGDAADRLLGNNQDVRNRLLAATAGKTSDAIKTQSQEAELDSKLATDFGKISNDKKKGVIQWATKQFIKPPNESGQCDTKTGTELDNCFTDVFVPKLNLDQKEQLSEHIQSQISQK